MRFLRKSLCLTLSAALLWLNSPAPSWGMAAAARGTAPAAGVSHIPALVIPSAGLSAGTSPTLLSGDLLAPSLPSLNLPGGPARMAGMAEAHPEAGRPQAGPTVQAKKKPSEAAVYVKLQKNLRPAEFAALKFLAKTPEHDAASRSQFLKLLRKGMTLGPSAGENADIRAVSAKLNVLFDAVENRGGTHDAPPVRAQASKPGPAKRFLRRLTTSLGEMVFGPSAGAVPAPTLPRGRAIRRGALIGVLLTVLPLAAAFAFNPLDSALGLSQYNFVPVLTAAHPILGTAASIFQQYILGIAITIGGISAVFGGILGKKPTTPAEKVAQLKRLVFGIGVPATLLAGGFIAGTALDLPILMVVPGMLLSLLRTVVMATGEEVVFRQWMFRKMLGKKWDSGRLRFWGSVFLSSAIFSVLHVVVHGFTLNLFLLKTLLGAMFALGYHRTGSLATSSAMHAAYNIFVGPSVMLFSPFYGSPVFAGIGWAMFGLTALLSLTLFPKDREARAPPEAPAWNEDTFPGVSFERAAEILRALSQKAGFRKLPVLELQHTLRTNDRAHKSPRKIVVTTSLLRMFNERELAAVLAHELGHLHHGTRRVARYVAVPPLAMMVAVFLALLPFDIFPWNVPLAGLTCLLTLFWGVNRYFSREEFTADRFAARLMGEGRTLATVLSKLPGAPTDPRVPSRIRRLLTP